MKINHLLSFGLFALLTLSAGQVAAQTTPTDLPPCQTNLGPEGEVLEGFDAVKALDSDLTVSAETKDGRGVLAVSGNRMARADQPPPPILNASGEPVIRLQFTVGTDTLVHACAAHVVAYDPARHDPVKMQVGSCPASLVAGMSQLMAGHAQVWRTPEPTEASPQSILDMSTLNAKLFLPLGNKPGLAEIAYMKKRQDGSWAIDLCPMQVLPAPKTIEDMYLCSDLQGKPIRLAPGQVATLQPRNPDGTPSKISEYMLQDHQVATVTGYDKAKGGPILQGVAAGSTSLVLLTGFSEKIVTQICEVVVE